MSDLLKAGNNMLYFFRNQAPSIYLQAPDPNELPKGYVAGKNDFLYLSTSFDDEGRGRLNLDQWCAELYQRFYKIMDNEQVRSDYRAMATNIHKIKSVLGNDFGKLWKDCNFDYEKLLSAVNKLPKETLDKISRKSSPEAEKLERVVTGIINHVSLFAAMLARNMRSEELDLEKSGVEFSSDGHITLAIATVSMGDILMADLFKGAMKDIGDKFEQPKSGKEKQGADEWKGYQQGGFVFAGKTEDQVKDTFDMAGGKGTGERFENLVLRMGKEYSNYLKLEQITSPPQIGFIAGSSVTADTQSLGRSLFIQFEDEQNRQKKKGREHKGGSA